MEKDTRELVTAMTRALVALADGIKPMLFGANGIPTTYLIELPAASVDNLRDIVSRARTFGWTK